MCHHVESLSDKLFVIGVIAICDWFVSDCFLSRVVCVVDIMSHDAHCITCFTIGFIAFESQINGIQHAHFPIEFIRRFVTNGCEQAVSCYCDIIRVLQAIVSVAIA